MARGTEGIRAREDPLNPIEAVERDGARPDHGSPARQEGRADGNHDRCEPANAMHLNEPAQVCSRAPRCVEPVRKRGAGARSGAPKVG